MKVFPIPIYVTVTEVQCKIGWPPWYCIWLSLWWFILVFTKIARTTDRIVGRTTLLLLSGMSAASAPYTQLSHSCAKLGRSAIHIPRIRGTCTCTDSGFRLPRLRCEWVYEHAFFPCYAFALLSSYTYVIMWRSNIFAKPIPNTGLPALAYCDTS